MTAEPHRTKTVWDETLLLINPRALELMAARAAHREAQAGRPQGPQADPGNMPFVLWGAGIAVSLEGSIARDVMIDQIRTLGIEVDHPIIGTLDIAEDGGAIVEVAGDNVLPAPTGDEHPAPVELSECQPAAPDAAKLEKALEQPTWAGRKDDDVLIRMGRQVIANLALGRAVNRITDVLVTIEGREGWFSTRAACWID